MHKLPGTVVLLVGHSGVGKTTLARHCTKHPRYTFVGSCTTRAPRDDDLPGDYEHMDRSTFETRRDTGLLATFYEFNNHLYGLPLCNLVDGIARGTPVISYNRSLVWMMEQRVTHVHVVHVVGTGSWTPRPGRMAADAAEAAIDIPIALRLENRFTDGFHETAAQLLDFLSRLSVPTG